MLEWVLAGLAATIGIGKIIGDSSKNDVSSVSKNFSTQNNSTDSNSPVWKIWYVGMTESSVPSDGKKLVTDKYNASNFYTNAVICPKCEKNMYKAVFSANKGEAIIVNQEEHKIEYLLTCPHCRIFYAPLEGKSLSAGIVYRLEFSNYKDYLNKLKFYDSRGIMQDSATAKPTQRSVNTPQTNATIMGETSNNSSKNRFIDYFSSIPSKNMLREIGDEYLRIMSDFPSPPTMGEYGSFEFAGALLMWKYCRTNYSSFYNKPAIGSFMIGIGEVIGCAFYQMPASEWSDKLDVVVKAHPEIILYEEWDKIYLRLKNEFGDAIHTMPFTDGLYYFAGLAGNKPEHIDVSRQISYKAFCEEYNAMPSFKQVFRKFERDGLRLIQDMSFDIDSNTSGTAQEQPKTKPPQNKGKGEMDEIYSGNLLRSILLGEKKIEDTSLEELKGVYSYSLRQQAAWVQMSMREHGIRTMPEFERFFIRDYRNFISEIEKPKTEDKRMIALSYQVHYDIAQYIFHLIAINDKNVGAIFDDLGNREVMIAKDLYQEIKKLDS